MRTALNWIGFFAAFIVTCAVIRSRQCFPSVAGVSEKWQHFEQHRHDYDVLFVGSSRMLEHAISTQFDAKVFQLSGQRVRSFNMACLAMWPPESFWFAGKILDHRPARLRWMFIDIMNIPPRPDPDVMGRRAGYWHDWAHTIMAADAVGGLSVPWHRKWTLWSEHAGYFFDEMTSRGRGAEELSGYLGPKTKRKPPETPPPWKETAGFLAEKRSTWLTGKHLADFARDVAEQRLDFARHPVPPALRRAVSVTAAAVRAAGVEPIFIATPTLDPREHFGDFDEGIRVWRFDHPAEYPALFDPALHYDITHLNEDGARVFTDLLAQRFAEIGR